jgi:hypothetical protein
MDEKMLVSYVFFYKDMQVGVRGDVAYSPDLDIEKIDIDYVDCKPMSNDEFHFAAKHALAQFESLNEARAKQDYIIYNFPDFRKAIYILYKKVSKMCDSILIEDSSDFTEMKEAIFKLYETI